jgi:hypothetical protein
LTCVACLGWGTEESTIFKVVFALWWPWNYFAWSLRVLQERSSYTRPLGLGLMKGRYYADSTGMMGSRCSCSSSSSAASFRTSPARV